jgi:hypothetical protein
VVHFGDVGAKDVSDFMANGGTRKTSLIGFGKDWVRSTEPSPLDLDDDDDKDRPVATIWCLRHKVPETAAHYAARIRGASTQGCEG